MVRKKSNKVMVLGLRFTEGKDISTLSLLRTQEKGLVDGFPKQEMFGLKVGGQGMTVFQVEGTSWAKAWCHREPGATEPGTWTRTGEGGRGALVFVGRWCR